MCWERCPEGKKECGALCLSTSKECSSDIKDVSKNVYGMAAAVAAASIGNFNVPDFLKKKGEKTFGYKTCEAPSPVFYQ